MHLYRVWKDAFCGSICIYHYTLPFPNFAYMYILYPYLKNDTTQKVKFPRKGEKLFFNWIENY